MPSAPRIVGRYALYGKIASGGMATVHFGRLLGPVGFSRTVAIKRLHPHFTEDPEFVSMFLDEARLAARIRHPNVVPTLDVVATDGELFLVMDFVQGETLARLLRLTAASRERIPVPIVAAIFSGMLHGLHAAHEAKNERGEPLGIVHRDVSPQNVIVGVDGTPRVLDFGVAKAAGRLQTTREGQLKGKISYMAPEQLRGAPATRQTDIYAAAVVLWESLAGRRLFQDENEAAVLHRVLEGRVERPSAIVPELSAEVDALVLRGLDRAPENRFATAREMATALERALALAIPATVGAWVEETAPQALAKQAARVAEIESDASGASIMIAQDGTTASAPPASARQSSAPPLPRSAPPRPAAGQTIEDATIAEAYLTPDDLEAELPSDAKVSSQMSSISVSTPAAPRIARDDRRRIAMAVGGATAGVALVAILAFTFHGRAAPAPPEQAGVAPLVTETPPVMSSQPAQPPPPPPLSPATSASAAAVSSSEPTPPPTSTASKPHPSTPHTGGAAAPTPHVQPKPAPPPPPHPKGGILFTNPG
jgi:hypothetical protein